MSHSIRNVLRRATKRNYSVQPACIRMTECAEVVVRRKESPRFGERIHCIILWSRTINEISTISHERLRCFCSPHFRTCSISIYIVISVTFVLAKWRLRLFIRGDPILHIQRLFKGGTSDCVFWGKYSVVFKFIAYRSRMWYNVTYMFLF